MVGCKDGVVEMLGIVGCRGSMEILEEVGKY